MESPHSPSFVFTTASALPSSRPAIADIQRGMASVSLSAQRHIFDFTSQQPTSCPAPRRHLVPVSRLQRHNPSPSALNSGIPPSPSASEPSSSKIQASRAQSTTSSRFSSPSPSEVPGTRSSDTRSCEMGLQSSLAELLRYQVLLAPPKTASSSANSGNAKAEEIRMAPLFSWDAKNEVEAQTKEAIPQYGVLGQIPSDQNANGKIKPILLNTNTPWSAFLCGSQGSGKSHALACMLENCLLPHGTVGKNPNPLAGLVFHYDGNHGNGVCEAAYLCSKIPITVLVSPSNSGKLADQYNHMNKKVGGSLEVKQLHLLPKYLDTARVKALMAVGDAETPLYMQTITKILREMATVTQGREEFNYQIFRKKIDDTPFVGGQRAPLDMRLDLLESFMKREEMTRTILPNLQNDFLKGQPGRLLIIDLTDPVIDADSACALFNICHSVFISQTPGAKIVALDEAHNYMAKTNAAAKEFTSTLVSSVRQQRHQGVRVVVATQEPSINEQLLGLCSITMVHRCSSPDWFRTLKEHIGAMYFQKKVAAKVDGEEGGATDTEDDYELFRKIMRLELGESLLFCPSAVLGWKDGQVERMNDRYVRFRTRQRITKDGGRSLLANGK